MESWSICLYSVLRKTCWTLPGRFIASMSGILILLGELITFRYYEENTGDIDKAILLYHKVSEADMIVYEIESKSFYLLIVHYRIYLTDEFILCLLLYNLQIIRTKFTFSYSVCFIAQQYSTSAKTPTINVVLVLIPNPAYFYIVL